ncbi:unnamed protein product [Adineta ricciae]|uniref:Uncharacterized protein n=1 Tax=Adineta ricciae TaxID=249248 RepID=A0A814ILD0_ADIRI|nr:unnamed protein product [Adineta ricciae]
MSDFYQLTNSSSDFKSRSNDVFDKLVNLEKQHDVHAKTQTPVIITDEETSSTIPRNPTIPSHAITFKKRPADDTFTRPADKWKKYDLDDVNEHHLSSRGNQHALNDFLRTRVKSSVTKDSDHEKEEEGVQSQLIFRRPAKKPILTDDEDNQFISVRAPASIATTEDAKDNDDEDDAIPQYKLKSTRKQTRGVASTNEKKSTKSTTDSSTKTDPKEEENEDDDINDDDDDEFFEP